MNAGNRRWSRLSAVARLGIAISVLAALLAGPLLTPARAATLVVSNNGDSGAGSLRQAVADAGSGDTITFAPTMAGQTISLSASLSLTKNVTVDGSGLATPVTVSGNGAVRVFSVASGVTAYLQALTIANGFADYGGAIWNHGTLTLSHCSISGNRGTWGGGIISDGPLTIRHSTLSGNIGTWGGALFNDGALTVEGSTFSGNTATFGGAIDNGTAIQATVADSTFAGNAATYGGAIMSAGQFIATNSTFSANEATYGGAIFSSDAAISPPAVSLRNCTISGTNSSLGSGLRISAGTLSFTNTIVANSPSAAECSVSTGTASIIANTNNLVEDGSCGAALSGDPMLGPLADNSGPTQTHAVLLGSPAIDSGDALACVSTDQRGVTRPLGAGCDIGAYEYPVPFAVTEAATAVTSRSATLAGTVNANYLETSAAFDYGPTTGYGTTVAAAEGQLAGLADTPVSLSVTGLTPNTTYHYRVVAQNSAGTTEGADRSFTTLALLPVATTLAADDLSPGGARLHGLVNAGNGNATVTFEYGPTTAYGESVTAASSPATGLEDTTVSAALTGLTPGITYHYRVVAENSAGRVEGADRTFTTGLYRLLLFWIVR